MASTVVAAAAAQDTSVSRSRTTKHGQKITYDMQVLQHPTQARACGSGSKSNTDRRPVDPPPIISMRVLEGEGPDATDITFAYRANFFVWASLEYARPLPHVRGPQSSVNPPVLCGTPVAGISYLDRPEPAGYFIFPDLSVRHEGNYCLKFTLYEDVKDSRYEDDKAPPIPVEATGGMEFVHCRCEIKSNPFQVYSAKKFPGLQESTNLSRMVAEQGCRVRIRRDVRMRKRETKGSRDWDSYEDETVDLRLKHNSSPAPDSVIPKPTDAKAIARSASVTSTASNQALQSVHQPVQDWLDSGRPYPPLPPSAHQIPQSPTTSQYYRNQPVGHEQPQMSSYVSQPYISEQQVAHSPQTMANSQMTPFNLQNPSAWAYGSQSQLQSPVYAPSTNPLRHNNLTYPSHDYPAVTTAASSYDAHQPQSWGMIETDVYGRQMQPHTAHYPIDRHTPMASSQMQSSYGMELPPLRNPASQSGFDRNHYNDSVLTYPHTSPYVTQAPQIDYMPQSTGVPTTHKRSYTTAFSPHHVEHPLKSGARPDSSIAIASNADGPSSDEDSFETEFRHTMQYRRADGTVVDRRWPAID